MYIGDKRRINVTSSRFSDFIESGCLYVDKTAFIEHVLQDDNGVLLFTRPRRMGKSLNMNTLAEFLDCKKDTAHLFSGLYIEKSEKFSEVNKYPVVYLDFVDLNSSDLDGLKKSFRRQIRKIIDNFFEPEEIKGNLKEYIDNPADYSPDITGILLEIIGEKYGKEPFLIVDEYDKVIVDTLNNKESDEIKAFIVNALQSALKGNTHFKQAVLTGVTRTTKESLFSTLNNLKVYDILHESNYDADFSLTEAELLELIPADEIDGVRRWYNNMRVGKELLYNIYSVMNYLSDGQKKLTGYWSMTGGGGLLSSLLNDSRADVIIRMLNDGEYRHTIILDCQLNMEHLKDITRCDDTSFYTVAVQAGYLTFELIEGDIYEIYTPNEEAKRVWSRLLLDYKYSGIDRTLANIFAGISNVDEFSRQLTDFVSMALSYHDIKEGAEWAYHVFFLGLVYSLGYECKSNLEAGLGRFDILIKSRRFCAVLEFKTSDSAGHEALQKKAGEAIAQIDEKEYWHEVKESPLPVYKIGIACHGKKCAVRSLLHQF